MSTLDLLERYIVLGPPALAEPEVAACVAANPEVVREIEAGVGALRQQMAPYRGPVSYPPRSETVRIHRPTRAQQHTSWVRRITVGTLGLTVAALIGWLTIGRNPAEHPHAAKAAYTTANGERSTFTLPDGTQVMLNVASVLRLEPSYGETSRTVILQGEAQFIVQHDATRPFVVRAGRTKVRDLATTFVVRAYPEAPTLVAVQDGRVRVDPPHVAPSAALHLDAGQFARVAADGAITSGRMGSRDQYFGWTHGWLTLQRVPLAEALNELSRWYDLEFRVSSRALLTQHLSITLAGSLSDEQLHAIADVLDAHVVREGRTVTFVPKARHLHGESQ